MLSAVVINADEGIPGYGFFNLAAELNRTGSADSDDAIWIAELEAVYEYWAS